MNLAQIGDALAWMAVGASFELVLIACLPAEWVCFLFGDEDQKRILASFAIAGLVLALFLAIFWR